MTAERKPGCRRLTVTEMFAGAGLFGYAFRSAGFELVDAIELCPSACATYRRNLGDGIVLGDVRKSRPAGRCDVIIAGPPCQGFSTLGKRRLDDPRNLLSYEVVDWARHARPSVIVIENVAAFLESPVWPRLCRRLRRLGYDVSAMVLDATDFGVPQLRRRSFTVASRIGLPRVRPLSRAGFRTVREALAGLPEPAEGGEGMHRTRPLSRLARARIRAIPEGGDKRDIMRRAPHLVPASWWEVPNEATDVWGRMEWDRPANTLRTAFINPSKGRYIHPRSHRVITFREAARLHTIPDHWEFCGNDSSIARQIGNSVPPLLGKAVADSIMRLFRVPRR